MKRRRSARKALHLALATALVLTPGCLLGSPLAAFSGMPYGMTVEDVEALQGHKNRIWSGAPFFAIIDIPMAFALDTAFLPIALIVWGIKALSGDGHDDDDDGHGDGRSPRDIDREHDPYAPPPREDREAE